MESPFYTQGIITKIAQNEHLETLIESFLIDRKAQNLSDGTLVYYRKKLMLLADFADTQAITKISQLTPDVLRRYLLWLEEHSHNPGGIHACYRALKAFLRWCWLELDLPGQPPISRIKAPRVNLEPLEPVELKQVERLIKACDKTFTGLRDKAIFLVLLDTGLRASEALSVNLDDLDLASGACLVRSGKGGKPRTVFFSQPTRRAIRGYLAQRTDDSPALFVTDDGTRLRYGGLRGILTRRQMQAGLQGVTLHSFRRATAINLLRAGVDVFSIQQLLGHSDLQILRRYLKQSSDDLRAAHSLGSPVDRLRRM